MEACFSEGLIASEMRGFELVENDGRRVGARTKWFIIADLYSRSQKATVHI